MRIAPKKLEYGQTLHFDEDVGGGVTVSVITQATGKAEISVHDRVALVPLFGYDGHLEDCIGRAIMLVGFFRQAAGKGEGV